MSLLVDDFSILIIQMWSYLLKISEFVKQKLDCQGLQLVKIQSLKLVTIECWCVFSCIDPVEIS